MGNLLCSTRGLDDVRLHDLRHSSASVAHELRIPLLIIGRNHGHKQDRTTAKYVHPFEDAMKSAADATAEQIGAWMAPATHATKVTVQLAR
jgi:integrase